MELIGCIGDIDDDRNIDDDHDVDDEYGFNEEYDFDGVVSIVGLFVRAKLTDSAQYIAIYITATAAVVIGETEDGAAELWVQILTFSELPVKLTSHHSLEWKRFVIF